MPEGHTIHRLARDLSASLSAGPVVANSPQGRFAEGAALIDGAELDRAEAWGKHLFCWWSTGNILHVHLGLIGKFRTVPGDTGATDTVRLRLENAAAEAAWQLTGPQTCAVITPDDRNVVVRKLGPDPLRRGAKRRSLFVERLTATRRPVGAALLDQSIIAGIGNVYRAELLLLTGIHPETPANTLDPELAGHLWDVTVEQLRRGLAWNRIVTVRAEDVDRRVTRRIADDTALYAYHRGGLPCRRCATPIQSREIGGRSIWFCPSCQAAA
ncbi:MAG: Fpg/Nei family DNA glycosylase [Acidimicrobiales bacterium]